VSIAVAADIVERKEVHQTGALAHPALEHVAVGECDAALTRASTGTCGGFVALITEDRSSG
jgi:hypothetical protein